ncbi:retinol dehydrogenase 12 isoform X1 [Leptinotarsa decemlineata]|uniref:retinol dehydrogenase 12 isoform X1 n=1 Tax=Leptinotarsa decemlineata TaxID=7539 RepID=UPI003D303EC7
MLQIKNIDTVTLKSLSWMLLAGYAAYIFFKSPGMCRCSRMLNDRVILITGGTSGIGKALSIELAKRGAQIILACKDVEKGVRTKFEIQGQVHNKESKVYVMYLDLCKFSSISKFSIECSKKFTKIDGLVNNAAVFCNSTSLTEDGFEIMRQANYYGHFLLLEDIMNLLRKSDDCRIVNVSGDEHRTIKNMQQLLLLSLSQQVSKNDDPYLIYAVTKLALILLTKKLAESFKREPGRITTNAVNPGVVDTLIFRNLYLLRNPFLWRSIIQSPRLGAQAILHCLLKPDNFTGQYSTGCERGVPIQFSYKKKIFQYYYYLSQRTLHRFLKEKDWDRLYLDNYGWYLDQ